MKTIFISSFNPFILRNILVSDALKIIVQDGSVRVVIFVPDYKVSFFEDQLVVYDNVVVEGIKTTNVSRQNIVFRFLGGSLVDTPTIKVHKRVQLAQDGRYVRFIVSWLLRKLLSRLVVVKRLVRKLDYLTMNKSYFLPYFSKYRPQLVFAADVFNDNDVHLLATARSQGIRTVGMIRSWDNFTTKGVFRIKPDILLVHNEILKSETVKYCDMIQETVWPVGIPQYDRYLNGSRLSRDAFFKKLDFDPARKLILFSPFGQRFTDTDWQIMDILKGLIEREEIPPTQVLVRCTPNDPVSLGGFIPNKCFYIDCPGRGFVGRETKDQELTVEDVNWLADCLHHCDVVVAGGASIGIDAATFGKPTILIHFDGFEEKPYWQSVRRFLEYQHPRDIISTGAMRSVRSAAELKQQLNSYLNNPRLDRPSREKMLRDQCWRLDGQSGQRIGRFLNSLLVG